jgi:hypothetical protein
LARDQQNTGGGESNGESTHENGKKVRKRLAAKRGH